MLGCARRQGAVSSRGAHFNVAPWRREVCSSGARGEPLGVELPAAEALADE